MLRSANNEQELNDSNQLQYTISKKKDKKVCENLARINYWIAFLFHCCTHILITTNIKLVEPQYRKDFQKPLMKAFTDENQ